MDRESLTRLRLDRRLIRRRGWIAEGDLAKELAKLPDVSAKIRPPDADPASGDSAAGGDSGSSSAQ